MEEETPQIDQIDQLDQLDQLDGIDEINEIDELAEIQPVPVPIPPTDTEENVVSNINSKIHQETIRDVLKMSFKDPKTKIHEDPVLMVTEIIRLLVMEGALRASKQASRDQRNVVELEQVEKILPQLILDFP